MKTILIVDDIETIRIAIREYLSQNYKILEASNGRKALEQLETHAVDLVLTDIRMPGMGGLELIEAMRDRHKGVKYILMTAYNINDYIQYARIRKIWNIIPKSSFLDLNHIRVMIDKMLSNDIFGIEHYIPGIQKRELDPETTLSDLTPNILYYTCVESTADNGRICDRAASLLERRGCSSRIRQILEELSANALGREGGAGFRLGYGIQEGYAILVTEDSRGSLKREEILYSLERQVQLDPDTGLPVGVFDTHGRGLFISREQLDHLIFNIDPGCRTEVIAIVNVASDYRARAISIYQKEYPEKEA